MMIRRFRASLAAIILSASALVAPATLAESSVDRLVAVLVAKGMLTAEEAQEVLADMEGYSSQPITAGAERQEPPRLRVSGDLRVRYQHESTNDLPEESRVAEEAGAARFRARVGADFDINDSWSVGMGLASGTGNPRSSNQTFDNGFPAYDANIDYAYIRYDHNQRASLMLGKFRNPVYTSADMLWDGDIRPEGIAAAYRPLIGDESRLSLLGGMFVLSDKELDVSKDAYMYLVQAHWQWTPNGNLSLDVAPAYYFSSDLQGTDGLREFSAPTNSRDSDRNLLYDYDAATLSANLHWTPGALVDDLELFGEYVYAPDPNEDNLGWLLGFAAGDSQLDRLGDWRFQYSYRRLERDAWPEFLQDSDFLFGATAARGHNLILELGLAPDVSMAVEYYLQAELIGSDIDQNLLQVDLEVGF